MEPTRGVSREQKMLGVTVAMNVFIISLLLDWVGACRDIRLQLLPCRSVGSKKHSLT